MLTWRSCGWVLGIYSWFKQNEIIFEENKKVLTSSHVKEQQMKVKSIYPMYPIYSISYILNQYVEKGSKVRGNKRKCKCFLWYFPFTVEEKKKTKTKNCSWSEFTNTDKQMILSSLLTWNKKGKMFSFNLFFNFLD
jgi:hypothetical protein